MKVDVVNLKGEKVEQIDLRDEVFGFDPNTEVLKQYVRVYQTNQRQGTSSTKTRSEVSGGGSKPWRQKGTGQARHGSTRSPIWTHGGVAHGPKPKNWRLSLSKKMRENALKSTLSMRMGENKIFVLDTSDIEKPSTKSFMKFLESLKIYGKTSFVWIGDVNNIIKSARNIPGVFLINAGSLGAYDVIKVQNVIFLKDAVLNVQERFIK